MNHPLVESWLVRFGDAATQYLVTTPVEPNLSWHLNYDGVYCCWLMSNLLAERNPTTSEALFRHAESLMALLSVWGEIGNAGPNDRPIGAPGYYNYNKGPRMMRDDPRSDPELADQYGTIAANFARGSAYSDCGWSAAYRWGEPPRDGSWPDEGLRWDPTNPPVRSREFSLSLLSHFVMDDVYKIYETRERKWKTTAPMIKYSQAHDWYLPEFLSRWFLGFDSWTGLDRPYRACIDQWRYISELAEEYNGDFTRNTELFTRYSWRPFMFAHTCRMLIHAYDHPAIIGHEYAHVFQSKILLALVDLCDISERWFTRPTRGGRTALCYEMSDEGIMPDYSSPDLALWHMPMWAWLYKMTGEQRYYDFAVKLAESGIEEAYVRWGKHFNQGIVWAYDGFDYLGLLSETEPMAIDFEALRVLVNDAQVESQQAEDARVDVDAADVAVADAQGDRTLAFDTYVRERDEKDAKVQEIIAALQAGLVE
jgi:hypothetical protein